MITERVDDLEVYRWLIALFEEAETLSPRCWSLASATALRAVAELVRRIASALYRSRLRMHLE